MSREDQIRWHRWISEQRGRLTDPARAAGDPGPAIAEFAMEASSFLRHPRVALFARFMEFALTDIRKWQNGLLALSYIAIVNRRPDFKWIGC
jgi:hypothetical protein